MLISLVFLQMILLVIITSLSVIRGNVYRPPGSVTASRIVPDQTTQTRIHHIVVKSTFYLPMKLGWEVLMLSWLSGRPSVHISFQEQISEAHEGISFILHAYSLGECRCAFCGLWTLTYLNSWPSVVIINFNIADTQQRFFSRADLGNPSGDFFHIAHTLIP